MLRTLSSFFEFLTPTVQDCTQLDVLKAANQTFNRSNTELNLRTDTMLRYQNALYDFIIRTLID